ncbi:MAG: hypothetical protein HYR64_02475 [Fimbriimonas ginsengisoli]|uniref:Uncharacterized protein n=1 Tax=Fimbriimonas ginsengisoli TaxID=1005039 RepID=A0A931PT40_FIMGI|nr:hypothetical protein [Fimbriimonas ginsengisoli]
MKQATLPLPEIGVIAATRGMLGAGVGLLLAQRMPSARARRIGSVLIAIGVISTIPLVLDVLRKVRASEGRG